MFPYCSNSMSKSWFTLPDNSTHEVCLNLQYQAQIFFEIQLKEESLKLDHLQQLLHAHLQSSFE
jgi:hypothetical protein